MNIIIGYYNLRAMAAQVGRARRANATMICGKSVPLLTISEQLMARVIKLRDKYGAVNIENGSIELIIRLWHNNLTMISIDNPHLSSNSVMASLHTITIVLSELDAYIAEHAYEILGRGSLTISHYNFVRDPNGERDSFLLGSDRWNIIRIDAGILTLSSCLSKLYT
jgi:hypothetical protein